MSTNEEKIQESLARIKEKQNKENEKIEFDISEFKDVKLKEGAEVDLTKVKGKGKLPDNFDLSELNIER